MRAWGALVVVALVACSTSPQPTTTTAPTVTSTTSSTASVPPAATFDLRDCGSAQPRTWSILCRAHDLIVSRSLYQPDAASLAAAAASGVAQIRASEAANPDDVVTCFLPDAAFDHVCEAIADRNRFEGIPISTLVEGAVAGMFRYGLDPYSSYLDPEAAASFQSIGPGHVLSLGMVVGARDADGAACGPISESCRLTVLVVFDVGPAIDAGIAVGETVTSIDGEEVEGISETEAAARMHGEDGATTVVVFDTQNGQVERRLTHVAVPLASVEYGPATAEILYLRLNDFSQQAAQAVGQILRSDDARGITGLILDLRGNPGGLVLSAQAVASQFLDEGIVLVEESPQGTYRFPVVEGGLLPPDVEIVVIVDGGTASAGEIVAAALQAAGRATVIGRPTFGKNVVQEVFQAPGGGEFRITVARWTGPDGTDVGKGGLQPDLLTDTDGDRPILEAVRLLEG